MLFSLVGAFYYLRVVWLMYFDPPGELPNGARQSPIRWVLALNALAILALGLLPGSLLDLCRQVIPGG